MAGSERTITALRALADALLATAEELPILADRCTELAAELEGGSALGPAMDAEQRPLIVTRMTQLTDLLHEAAGEVRRAEAHQLRSEGSTMERIARAFGVTRQRVSALLRPQADERRRPYRPRPNHR